MFEFCSLSSTTPQLETERRIVNRTAGTHWIPISSCFFCFFAFFFSGFGRFFWIPFGSVVFFHASIFLWFDKGKAREKSRTQRDREKEKLFRPFFPFRMFRSFVYCVSTFVCLYNNFVFMLLCRWMKQLPLFIQSEDW